MGGKETVGGGGVGGVGGYKNEAEAAKAFKVWLAGFNSTLDSIFSGLIESGRANTAALLLVGDPIAALDSHGKTLQVILDEMATLKMRLEVNSLYLGLLRPVQVYNSTPERDKNVITLKGALPSIHAWTWRVLANVVRRVDATGPFTPILKYFVNHYPIPLNSTENGILVRDALFEFLTALTLQESVHSLLVNPISKYLVEMVIEALESCKKSLVKPSVLLNKGTNPAKKSKVKNYKGKNHDDDDHNDDYGGGCTNQPTILLEWLSKAMYFASFQTSLPRSTKALLINSLVDSLSCSPSALALKALSAVVLAGQPAYLSPDLPLLLRITAVALHSSDFEIRSEAFSIARKVDFIIRPRRPYAPTSLKKPSLEDQSNIEDELKAGEEEEKGKEGGKVLDADTIKVNHQQSKLVNHSTITQGERPAAAVNLPPSLVNFKSTPVVEMNEREESLPLPSSSSSPFSPLKTMIIGDSTLSKVSNPNTISNTPSQITFSNFSSSSRGNFTDPITKEPLKISLYDDDDGSAAAAALPTLIDEGPDE